MTERRLRQWMIAYILIEVIIFCAILGEVYVLHPEDPILLSYLGVLIICFVSLGLLFATILVVPYFSSLVGVPPTGHNLSTLR